MEVRLESGARRGVDWGGGTEGSGELTAGGVGIFKFLEDDGFAGSS